MVWFRKTYIKYDQFDAMSNVLFLFVEACKKRGYGRVWAMDNCGNLPIQFGKIKRKHF